MENNKPDFSGWATKADIKCSDGRTIKPKAFSHQHNITVPLVWQHRRTDPENVLGHVNLEDRAFGVYAYGYFDNSSERAQKAKTLVHGKKINALSIYATGLAQRGLDVYHGDIEEVSLVHNGANPEAFIENIYLSHSDEIDPLDSEAIIYTGLTLEHQDNSEEGESSVAEDTKTEEKTDDKTVKEVFDELTEEQKNVVYYMIGQALEGEEDSDDSDDADDSGGDADDTAEHSITADEFLAHIDQSMKEGFKEMSRNAFEQYGDGQASSTDTLGNTTLTHADFSNLVIEAQKVGSLKEVVLEHADYGIENIEMLFPDARAMETQPDFISRRMEWVSTVLKGTKHSPFAKVKTVHADITEPEARAKGYITGKRKKEEVFKLLKRTTSPTTIYKKQKLDRDDILDITDFDVVVWLRAEMRIMLEEEIARAILVGDGRDSLDDDKVKDPEGAHQGEGIRSILHDDELYAHPVTLQPNVEPLDMVEGIIRARTHFRGSGKPTLFISDNALTDILLEKDKLGRYIYETEQVLADKLRVKEIVTVELFDEHEDLLAIIVNLMDYTVGANKGGEITNFDDFDIDFNQHKYLSETRLSGGLTKPKSAIVVKRAQGTLVYPTPPEFDAELNMISIPNVTGVDYYINDEKVTGDQEIQESTEVRAFAAEGYFFNPNTTRRWTYTYTEQEQP